MTSKLAQLVDLLHKHGDPNHQAVKDFIESNRRDETFANRYQVVLTAFKANLKQKQTTAAVR